MLDKLCAMPKVFGEIDFNEITPGTTVEFETVGTPQEVSFNPKSRRKDVDVDKAREALQTLIDRGIAQKVPHHEKAYGFAFIIKKANGKLRVTVNPKEVNGATARVTRTGSYMEENSGTQALHSIVGRGRRYLAKIDLRDAFQRSRWGQRRRCSQHLLHR